MLNDQLYSADCDTQPALHPIGKDQSQKSKVYGWFFTSQHLDLVWSLLGCEHARGPLAHSHLQCEFWGLYPSPTAQVLHILCGKLRSFLEAKIPGCWSSHKKNAFPSLNTTFCCISLSDENISGCQSYWRSIYREAADVFLIIFERRLIAFCSTDSTESKSDRSHGVMFTPRYLGPSMRTPCSS